MLSSSPGVGLSGFFDAERELRSARVVADSQLFLGNDLLAYLVLALGGALVVGNGLALVRPPAQAAKGDLRRAPIARTVVMIVVGLVATVWSLASLLSR